MPSLRPGVGCGSQSNDRSNLCRRRCAARRAFHPLSRHSALRAGRRGTTPPRASVRTDFGATWNPLGNGITAHNAGSTIDPSFSARLWTGTDSQIYRSIAAGEQDHLRIDGIDGDSVLTSPPVTALLIDPAVPGRVFAGTEAGLYSTADAGVTWSLEPGIPRTYISRLRLDGRKLFAFTLGRGAWRAVLNTCSALPAPASLTATATSTSATSLSWSAVNGAGSYEVHRSSGNGPFTLLKTVSTTSTTDTGLSSNTAYVYKVRGVCGAFSPLDVATTTLFTNDPLTAGTTIRTAHLTQLRTAIDAVRTAAGLQPASYTSSIAAASIIRRTHITEMRTALDAARSAIGLTAISYIDATITAGATKVKAAHVTDLRNGVK